MLTVTDARTRTPVEVTGARPGLLTVRVVLRCADGTAGPADLRALVVADVLRRAVEVAGRQSLHAVEHPPLDRDRTASLERSAAALGVAPASEPWPHGGGAADVVVLAEGTEPDGDDALRIAVGGVTGWVPRQPPPDPGALRLALLRQRHADPAPLGPDRLASAARTLAGWRRSAAAWAREPSHALPGEVKAAARGALARDLDTVALLTLLDTVAEAPGLAPGGRFEVFAYLDRFAGLELTRDVGTR